MTAPSPASVSTADVSKLFDDIHLDDINLVARHIATVGDLLRYSDETLCIGDLINDLGMRILRDLDSYSSQSSN
jgi:hypothetical protein